MFSVFQSTVVTGVVSYCVSVYIPNMIENLHMDTRQITLLTSRVRDKQQNSTVAGTETYGEERLRPCSRLRMKGLPGYESRIAQLIPLILAYGSVVLLIIVFFGL